MQHIGKGGTQSSALDLCLFPAVLLTHCYNLWISLLWGSLCGTLGTLGLGRMRVKLKVLQECKEHQMSKAEKWEGEKKEKVMSHPLWSAELLGR